MELVELVVVPHDAGSSMARATSRRGPPAGDPGDPALGPADPADPDVPRTARRWWGWLVVAGVVVALVVAQAVVTARGRAADARLADVPGTVSPVARPLSVAWRPTRGEAGVLTTGVHAGGSSIGVLRAADGSRAIVAIDDETGAHRWVHAVSGPDTLRAQVVEGDLGGRTGSCRGVPSGASAAHVTAVACVVTDGVVSWDTSDPPLTLRPATHGDLLVLDAATGAVTVERAVRPPDAFGVVGDLLVTADVDPDGRATLVATDLATGAHRWRWTTPDRLGEDVSGGDVLFGVGPLGVRMFGAGPGGAGPGGAEPGGTGPSGTGQSGAGPGGPAVALSGPDGAVTVLSHDGSPVHGPAGGGAWNLDAAGDGVVLPTGDASDLTSLLVRPGQPDRTLPGRAVDAQVDDGSLRDVQLTTQPTLRAWDLRTGVRLWDAHVATYRTVAVLGGRVFVQTSGGVAAVDGRTGRVLWSHAAPRGTSLDAPTSDGRVLLVVRTPTAPGADSALGAYRLDDGVPLWSEPLPAGVFRVYPAGRALVGYTADGPAVLAPAR